MGPPPYRDSPNIKSHLQRPAQEAHATPASGDEVDLSDTTSASCGRQKEFRMAKIPPRYLLDSTTHAVSFDDPVARYYLCLQIQASAISSTDVCSRYGLALSTLDEWKSNYLSYDCATGDCVIDDVGRAAILEIANQPRVSGADEERIRAQLHDAINAQLQYTTDRAFLRLKLAIYSQEGFKSTPDR